MLAGAGFAGASVFAGVAGVFAGASFEVSAFLLVESLSSPVPGDRAIAGDTAKPNARMPIASARIPFLLEFNSQSNMLSIARAFAKAVAHQPHTLARYLIQLRILLPCT